MRVGGEVVAVQLDESVREPADGLGRVVRLAVPARVHVGRQPEVGAEIDDVRHVVEQAGQQRLARAVRQRAEHEVEPAQIGRVERREHRVAVRRSERRERATATRAPAFDSAVRCTTSISGWPASSRSNSAPV